MRRATQEEEAAVRNNLEGVEKTLFRRFMGDRRLAAVDRENHVDIVLVDKAFFDLPAEVREGSEGGLLIGSIDDGFAMDLQGAIIFARETRAQTVTVHEKVAHLFLYGRDVLSQSILAFDKTLNSGDHCIVTNPRHEALGIGLVVGRFKGSGGRAVEPVRDLGSYLRDQ